MEYKLDVYDVTRNRIGIIDSAVSVQWLEHYQDVGEMLIVTRITDTNYELLRVGHRVYNSDSDTVMYIVNVEYSTDTDYDTIVAHGVPTAWFLSQRVLMATQQITNIEAGLYTIYTDNRRNLPIGVAASEGYTDSLDMEVTWNTIYDAYLKICETSGLGFKVLFDPETAAETLKVYKGADRTNETRPDYVGAMSTGMGKLETVQLAQGEEEFKNVAIVAGEDSGSSRRVRTVSIGTVAGEARREMYVDARDIQSEYQIATFNGTYDTKGNPNYNYTAKSYTTAQYNALLDTRGREKLSEQLQTFTLNCSVSQLDLVLGEDYFLGDIMPVFLPEFGFMVHAVIASVNRVYEVSGSQVVITFKNVRVINL